MVTGAHELGKHSVIVQLREDRAASDSVRRSLDPPQQRAREAGAPETPSLPLEAILARYPSISGRPLFKRITNKVHESPSPSVQWSIPEGEARNGDEFPGLNVLTLPVDGSAHAVAEELSKDPRVRYAHVPAMRYLLADPSVPDDPNWGEQWALSAAAFPLAWEAVEPANAPLLPVAVIDSGVAQQHPDLAATIRRYETFGAGVADLRGHGTKVCGILAGQRNNAVGMAGGARASLDVYRVYDPDFSNQNYYESLRAVSGSDVCAMNVSVGGTVRDPTEEQLITACANAGIGVVAAIGNEFESGSPRCYPAAYAGVVAVGASDRGGGRAPFSSTGDYIWLGAPGVDIVTTTVDPNHYEAVRGTSFAAPLVTAACVLITRKYGRLSTLQLRGVLASLTRRADGLVGWDPTLGNGPLDLSKLQG